LILSFKERQETCLLLGFQEKSKGHEREGERERETDDKKKKSALLTLSHSAIELSTSFRCTYKMVPFMYRSYSEKAPSALFCVPQEKKGKKEKEHTR